MERVPDVVFVRSPFDTLKRDLVVERAVDFINLGQERLDKLINHPLFTDREKKQFCDDLADLAKMTKQLDERRGMWPKFVYSRMKNPNRFMRHAQNFHRKVMITSSLLTLEPYPRWLSTAPYKLNDDDLNSVRTSSHSSRPPRSFSQHSTDSGDSLLPDVLEILGRHAARTGEQIVTDPTTSKIRTAEVGAKQRTLHLQSEPDVIGCKRPGPQGLRVSQTAHLVRGVSSGSVPESLATTAVATANQEPADAPLRIPVQAEIVNRHRWNFVNSSETSFGGTRHDPGDPHIDATAVTRAVEAIKAARGKYWEPDPWNM